MQDKFLSYFTHELRTLIAAIFTCTDLLTETLEDRPDAVEMIRVIRRSSDHVLKMINNALDISKIEAGKMVIEQIDCDPGQAVADVISLMRPAAAEKNLTIDIERCGFIPQTIRTDPTRLRQVLLNLVDNAIKFTDRGGVLVSMEIVRGDSGKEGWFCFHVRDTGIGLTHEQLERVFDPFVQADISTARCHGGTGLGLAISKQLACLLGGDLVIDSKPNEGLIITLTVPTGSIDGMAVV